MDSGGSDEKRAKLSEATSQCSDSADLDAYRLPAISRFPLRIGMAFVPAVLIFAIPAAVLTTQPKAGLDAFALPMLLIVATPFYELAWAYSWVRARQGPVKPNERYERVWGTFLLAVGMTIASYCVAFGGCIAVMGLGAFDKR